MTKAKATAAAQVEPTTALSTSSTPDAQLVAQATALINQAKALPVANKADYTVAADVLANMRGAYQKLDGQRKGITDKLRSTIEDITNLFKPKLTELTQAGEIVKAKMLAYDEAERIRAAAEQRRVEEAARKEREAKEAEARRVQAESERKAKEAREEAERQRQAAAKAEADRKAAVARAEQAERDRKAAVEEAERAKREAAEAKRRGDAAAEALARQKQADATRIAAEEKARQERAEQQARDEQARQATALKSADKLDDKATATESRGEAKADALLDAAATTVAPIVEADHAKVKGNRRTGTWKYRLKDASKLSRTFLMPDDSKIAKQVKALGEEAHAVIGEGAIEIYFERDIAVVAKK